jgi:prepilin-type N-terminal cleavage/methylation domain-containing protein
MRLRGAIAGRHAGFTLIEMILAVAILGLILAMLAESFHAVASSKLHAEGRLYTEREGRAVMWELSNELIGAVQTAIYPSNVIFLGTAHFDAGVAVNSLTVSTLDAAHRRSIDSYGAEQVVSYQPLPNPAHRGWFLLERTQQSALAYGSARPVPIVIADNLISLRLRYFDGQQWGEVWNSRTLSPGRQLPVAVAIDLSLGAPGGHTMKFSTQVMLPMAVAQW